MACDACVNIKLSKIEPIIFSYEYTKKKDIYSNPFLNRTIKGRLKIAKIMKEKCDKCPTEEAKS